MTAPNYPGNSKSHKPAAEPKKVEKVVTGDVVQRKKPLGKRLSETFVGGDLRSTVQYVFFDILVPAARDTVADAGSQGLERLIFGEARSVSRRTGRAAQHHTSYDRFSKSRPDMRQAEERQLSRRARGSHDFGEILLATRVEANEVLNRLNDLVDRYTSATVADLYALVGITGNYTDDKWGWRELNAAGITRVPRGYVLDLPSPIHLD